MSAYLIVDVNVFDHEDYEEYKKLTPASIRAYDGEFIIRGGATEVIEGNWEPGRIVVLRFPTAERARQWWNSAEYATAKSIRQQAATTKMILIEGA